MLTLMMLQLQNNKVFYFLSLKIRKINFNQKDCDCEFSIIENGNVIYAQPLFENNKTPNLSNASVFYTFPKEDVYQIKIMGKPINVQTFKSFTLIYDIRVDREEKNIPTKQINFITTHGSHLIIFGIMLFFFIIFF